MNTQEVKEFIAEYGINPPLYNNEKVELFYTTLMSMVLRACLLGTDDRDNLSFANPEVEFSSLMLN
jgi:hypothetical protein